MQKVITINLNGNAYQLDEEGYEALRAYLAHAHAQLGGNPDASEIIRDLEQSIAEKCQRLLGPGKSVVTPAEIEQILREIGPVENSAGAAHGSHGAGPAGTPQPKRLYQIREGAIVSGVANGLAAYFNVDPTIVRVAFAVAAVLEMTSENRPPDCPHHRAVRVARIYRAVREDAGRAGCGARRVDDPSVQTAARRRKGEGQIRWPSPQSSLTQTGVGPAKSGH